MLYHFALLKWWFHLLLNCPISFQEILQIFFLVKSCLVFHDLLLWKVSVPTILPVASSSLLSQCFITIATVRQPCEETPPKISIAVTSRKILGRGWFTFRKDFALSFTYLMTIMSFFFFCFFWGGFIMEFSNVFIYNHCLFY